jgi:hypothetical protein
MLCSASLCTVEGWMKSRTSLVCIITAAWFVFQIKTQFFFESIHFDACIRTPFFSYKCAQLNSLLWRSCWDRILVNLPHFPQGLDPFKICGRFKLNCVPDFILWIMLRIWSRPNWESCLKYSNLAACKVWIFFDQGKAFFLNLQLCVEFEKLKIDFYWAGPSCQRSAAVFTVQRALGTGGHRSSPPHVAWPPLSLLGMSPRKLPPTLILPSTVRPHSSLLYSTLATSSPPSPATDELPWAVWPDQGKPLITVPLLHQEPTHSTG